MKLYKRNMGYFINCAFWVLAFSFDPIWILISQIGPVTLLLPLVFGYTLGYWEKDIDWEMN